MIWKELLTSAIYATASAKRFEVTQAGMVS